MTKNYDYIKAWRAANPDKVRATHRRHYAKHSTKRRAATRTWQKENAARNAVYRQNEREKSPVWFAARTLFCAARSRAKARGVPLSITVGWVYSKLLNLKCDVTGLPFDFSGKRKGLNFAPFSPSLDRRNPAKGYTKRNVRVVVTAFNLGRGVWSDAVYVKVATAYLKKRNRLT